MSMSTHVVGFKPPDEKWKAMKKVWDACLQAKVSPPREVYEFFEGMSPDPAGVEFSERKIKEAGALREWHNADHCAGGFEVDLTKLPPDVKTLRFFNSW